MGFTWHVNISSVLRLLSEGMVWLLVHEVGTELQPLVMGTDRTDLQPPTINVY